MAINRFYSPSQSRYLSQFIPDQLPADLMIAGIGKKQQQYDAMSATLQQLGEWEQRALPGYDTKYVGEKKQSIENFITDSLNRDLASPEYIREYQKFVKDFQGDEGLKMVSASVATHDQYLERVKKLKEGNGTEYDKAFVENYERHYNEYTAETGLGYTGDTQLADPSIFEGVDLNKEMEAYFDQLQASGSESIKFLGEGLAYKNGWTGINGQKIDDQVGRVFDTFYSSRAGQQLQARFEADNIPAGTTYENFYQSLSEDDRLAFENAKRTYVANQLTNTGMGFTFSKSTTNADVAYRTKAGWDREDMKLYPQNPEIVTSGNTLGTNGLNYSQAMQLWQSNNEALGEHNKAIQSYEQLLGIVNGTTQIERDALGRPILDPSIMNMLQGIPGAKNFLSGQALSSDEKAVFTSELEKKIGDHKYVLGGIEIQQENMEYQMRSSIESLNPNMKFGPDNVSFSNALELGEQIRKEGVLGDWIFNLLEANINTKTREEFEEYSAGLYISIGEDVRMQIANGTLSKEEGLKILNNMSAMEAWGEAKFYQKTVQENPLTNKAIIANYNQEGSYQPLASMMPLNETYVQYSVDANGNPIKLGPAYHADYYMQNLARTQPNNFAIYIGNERITPGDPRYPDASTIEFGSANLELVNGKPVFNGIGTVNTVIADPKGTLDVDGNVKNVERKEVLNYTFVAEGVSGETYMAAKANEAYSNVIIDQGYDPTVPLQYQQNLSPTGQASLQKYVMAIDPELGNNVSNMEQMQSGENIVFRRPMYSPYTGDTEQVKYSVQRTDTGEYIVSATDEQGRAMYPGAPEVRFASSAQVGTWIKDTETLMNQDGSNGVTYAYPTTGP